MTFEDPISGQEYEESINGIKLWCATEFPFGLPFAYALVGFIAITTVLSSTFLLTTTVTGWSLSPYGFLGIAILGLFWAFGGWQEGEKEQKKINDRNASIDPWEKHDDV